MKVIDCRGLQCPAPVVATKKALDESSGNTFKVILDNGAPLENVIRYCKTRGCKVTLDSGEETSIVAICTEQPEQLVENIKNSSKSPVILIASDRLGSGADDLGRLLLKNFIITLLEMDQLPDKVILINSGVLLTAKDSEFIVPMTKLSNAGVEILSCGICLDYYGIRESLSVGGITNMYSIAESMLLTGNLIRL